MRKFYLGSANDDLNEEQMATALQVSVAVLPLTKIVNLFRFPFPFPFPSFLVLPLPVSVTKDRYLSTI